MSNIKWTGIEQWKYGLTARWYVSAYYGNDVDVDAVGLYNPSTNPAGHGGQTRPFATADKAFQQVSGVIIFDSGNYTSSTIPGISRIMVGDGTVVFGQCPNSSGLIIKNIKIISSALLANITHSTVSGAIEDCDVYFSSLGGNQVGVNSKNSRFTECSLASSNATSPEFNNCIFKKCLGTLRLTTNFRLANNVIIQSPDLVLNIPSERPVSSYFDYSIIIGTVKTSIAINGKTTGVTIEDFKSHGQYFIKSYSEVDLFGNVSGSGATVTQLNEIFNNFYYPYIDDYHNLDLTLKPDCDERVRFGGLNGTYIGAKPVGYRFSAWDLWNTHIDSGNTSNLTYDMVNNAIVLASGQDVGTYTSLIIDLGVPITVDMVDFMANFVYNIEGTAKQGVANQRIDTTPDLQPDNTANQRVVYDYRLQYSPDDVTALTDWENLELNRMPTKDSEGLHQLDTGFDQTTAQKLTIQRLKIEFTLRRVIID